MAADESTQDDPTKKEKAQASTSINGNRSPDDEKILCPHCLRTATNGIKCQGICVSDSDY